MYFSLMGLTGSALIFKSESQRLFNPSLYYVVRPENSSRLSMLYQLWWQFAITDKLGVRMVSPGGPYVVPRCVTVFFNESDANLLRVEDPAKLPLGQQIMAWLLPIHFGQWGPGISQCFVKVIWFVAGLCPSVSFGSGVMMVMLKRGAKF